MRIRPVPFRTRKLSSPAPMVLHTGVCGRVGRRRPKTKNDNFIWFFRSVTHECVGDAPFFFVSMIGGVVRGGGVWVLSVGGVCGWGVWLGVYESDW